MNTYFTGRQIKTLSKLKDLTAVVFRLRSNMQQIDFSQGEMIQTSIECNPGFSTAVTGDHCSNDWVEMFPKHNDTSWQFFVAALKPADQVIFYERNNGNQFEEEAGLQHIELRGRVTGHKKDGTLSYIREITIKCRVIKKR